MKINLSYLCSLNMKKNRYNNQSSKNIDLKRFSEILLKRERGINIINNRAYKLFKPMRVPGKTAMILDIE